MSNGSHQNPPDNTPEANNDHPEASGSSYFEIFNRRRRTQDSTSTDRSYQIYLAGLFGSFCIAFGDLMNNPDTGTINHIQLIITKHFLPTGSGSTTIIIALLLIMLCGTGICWVHKPENRMEAFTRGLSIFAIFALGTTPSLNNYNDNGKVANPPGEHAAIYSSSPLLFEFVTTAYAQDNATIGDATIRIEPQKDGGTPTTAKKITLREKNTGKFVAQEVTSDETVLIRKPVGDYSMEVEMPGHRRTVTTVPIEKEPQEYKLAVPTSSIPQGIQKLYSPKPVALTVDEPIQPEPATAPTPTPVAAPAQIPAPVPGGDQ